MYKLTSLHAHTDFFLPLSKRNPKGIYFYRFIGYDNSIIKFLQEYLKYVNKEGYYFNTTISNPSDNDVKLCIFKLNSNFSLSIHYIEDCVKRLFNFLNINQQALLRDSLFSMLSEMKNQGANENIIKNAAIKFFCWCNSYNKILKFIGSDNPPKILYEGTISKYEVYFLKILACCGCDVVYVNFEDESTFTKYDKNFSKVIYGEKKGPLSKHFSKINISELAKNKTLKEKIAKESPKIIKNIWVNEDFFDCIEKPNNIRALTTGDFTCIHTLFLQFIGINEKAEYNNKLYFLDKSLKNSYKPYILFDNKIDNPSFEEVSKISKFAFSTKDELINELLFNISENLDNSICDYTTKALFNTLSNEDTLSLNQLYNLGIKLICWLNRLKSVLYYKNNILPIIIYYGECSKNELIFLNMLSNLPVDILYFCPKRTTTNLLKAEIIELSNSCEIKPFPKEEFKIRVATTAYTAERDLDNILYTDTGLYRNKQFSYSYPLTLKTIYEEVQILWQEEAKFRPSFKTENEKVYVPNIFAKISGIKDGDIHTYFKEIKNLITKDTLIYTKYPLVNSFPSIDWKDINKFIIDGVISKEKLFKSQAYKYSYLNDNTQNLIAAKINELLNLNWIIQDGSFNVYYLIINTLLNIDKKTLMLIQQFDFTKDIPKIIIIDTNESMPSVNDCIYLLFLNLIGFDIVVFTPTGYKNIEKYIKEDAFQSHIIGKFMFDVEIPDIHKNFQKKNTNSFFNRLFKN